MAEILETLTTSRIFDGTFPVVVSFSSFSNTVQAGDVILAVCAHANTSDASPGVSTSDYAEVSELYADDTYDINLSVNYKRMGATPDSSVTFSTASIAEEDALVVSVSLVRGVDSGTVLDVSATTATGSNSSIPNPASITPTTTESLVVIIGAYSCYKNNYVDPPTPPTGYTAESAIHGAADVGSNGAALVVASKEWSSGTEDPGVWSGITEDTARAWAAVTLAFRPLSETGTTYSFVASGGAIAGGAASIVFAPAIVGSVDLVPAVCEGSAYGYVQVNGSVIVDPQEDVFSFGGPAYVVGYGDIQPDSCNVVASGYIPIHGSVVLTSYQDDVAAVASVPAAVYGFVSVEESMPILSISGTFPITGFTESVQGVDDVFCSGYIPVYAYVNVSIENDAVIFGFMDTDDQDSLWFNRGTIIVGSVDSTDFVPLTFER